jgi:hypothetical protein
VGSTGVQGNQGNQGNQGWQGSVGSTGVQGNQGNQGWQGLVGSTGVQGNQGNQGWQGWQGSVGSTGVQGNQGNQGWQGYQGPYTPTSIDAQSGTTYTLALSDAFECVTLTNSSAITVTVPPNSSVAFAISTSIDFLQLGTGLVTFAAGTGVTINSKSGILYMNGQYSGATLIKTATNTWELVGVGLTSSFLPSRQAQITSATTTISTTWASLLTTTWTTNIATNYLIINFTSCVKASVAGTAVSFQVTLDGVDIGVTQVWVVAVADPSTAAIAVRIACSGNASHTVVVNWRTTTGTATVDPTQTHSSGTALMHANMVIQEVAS